MKKATKTIHFNGTFRAHVSTRPGGLVSIELQPDHYAYHFWEYIKSRVLLLKDVKLIFEGEGMHLDFAQIEGKRRIK